MAQLVPFLSENEQSTEAATAAHLTIVFDGTSRLGEALAIVFRYVDCDFETMFRASLSCRRAFSRLV